MTPDEQKHRANLAREITENPIIAEAIARLVGDKFDKIIELPTWTPWAWKKRRELIADVRALKNVQAALAEEILSGEHAGPRGLGVA